MNKIFFKKIFPVLIFLLLLGWQLPVRSNAATGSFNVNLNTYTCNNNGVCDAGETIATCPVDCVCNHNGVCDAGETTGNCPDDCQSPPPPPPPTPIPLVISLVNASAITVDSAQINWSTNLAAICQLSWGPTIDYGLGASAETVYKQSHSSSLTGLDSNTTYHYFLACQTSDGLFATTGDNQFKTLVGPNKTPPNPIFGLRVIPGDKENTLIWDNPADPNFVGVKIRRSTTLYPDLNQGILIYDGVGNPTGGGDNVTYVDTGLTNGVIYYYSVFVYNSDNLFSTGVVGQGTPFGPGQPPTTTTPPIVIPPGTILPPGSTTTPSGKNLYFHDFIFSQAKQNLPVNSLDEVNITTELPLTVELPPDKILSGTAKMILNIVINGQVESFLYTYDPATLAYRILLPGISEMGRHNTTMVVYDNSNQQIKQVSGWIIVAAEAPLATSTQPRIITATKIVATQIAKQVAVLNVLASSPVGKGTAAGVMAISAVNLLTFPWWNLWALLTLLFSQPLFFFQKRRGWGTVYNAITKKPVDLALVRLYDNQTKKLVTSRVTDTAGRYLFLVSAGEYYLQVEKTNFSFPDALLKNVRDDGQYTDLYYGEVIKINSDERAAIIANIPLDPQLPDLTDQQVIKQFSKERFTKRMSWLGPIFAGAYFIVFPSWFSGAMVLVHLLALWLFWRLAQRRGGRQWGVIRDNFTKRPAGHSVARIFSSEYGRMLEVYATDNSGRYGFLVGHDKYYVTADKEGYQTAKTPMIDLINKDAKQAAISQDLILVKKTDDKGRAAVLPPVVEKPAVSVTSTSSPAAPTPVQSEPEVKEAGQENIFG